MIRKARREDFEFIYGLYMHPDVNEFLLYEYMDRESFKPIFEELRNSEVLYLYEFENCSIGMFKLVRLKFRTSHIAYLGGLAIHPDFTGKGEGSKMMAEILMMGHQMNLVRMELSTSSNNAKA